MSRSQNSDVGADLCVCPKQDTRKNNEPVFPLKKACPSLVAGGIKEVVRNRAMSSDNNLLTPFGKGGFGLNG
jgi:hypothetical protein